MIVKSGAIFLNIEFNNNHWHYLDNTTDMISDGVFQSYTADRLYSLSNVCQRTKKHHLRNIMDITTSYTPLGSKRKAASSTTKCMPTVQPSSKLLYWCMLFGSSAAPQ